MKRAVIYKESDSSYEDIKEVNTIEDLLLISQNYSLFIGKKPLIMKKIKVVTLR